jgi:hypothetical protein
MTGSSPATPRPRPCPRRPTCTTAYVAGNGIGTYATTCSGAVADNYDITYVPSSFKVTKKAPDDHRGRQAASVQRRQPAPHGTISGTVNGDVITPNYSTTAVPLSDPTTYPITATPSGAALSSYSLTVNNGTLTVAPENATLEYSGGNVGVLGTSINLQATVREAQDGSLGNITKMWVRFEVVPNCTGSAMSLYAPVIDTGATGDGVGTASIGYVVSGTQDTTVCLTMSVVAGQQQPCGERLLHGRSSAGDRDLLPQHRSVRHRRRLDRSPRQHHGKSNFGFNARFKNKQAQGQMVYVWRGSYNGVAANYMVKSNCLSTLGFTSNPATVNGYPMEATLTGRCTIQISRAKAGYQLASVGNVGFMATATDSGLPSSTVGMRSPSTSTATGWA